MTQTFGEQLIEELDKTSEYKKIYIRKNKKGKEEKTIVFSNKPSPEAWKNYIKVCLKIMDEIEVK